MNGSAGPEISVLRPADEAEVAVAIREAQGPLRIRGGGTRTIGPDSAAGVLSLDGLRGIELYDPGAMTLVVRAGTPLAQVQEVLAAEGQRLAFEPPDWRGLLGREGISTIGGVVAANASGPRRVQAGAARDHVLGLRFVDGAGRILRNGGRVMKNVTGYDLARLLTGSRGRLGVLTEIALRVMPRPETEATLMLSPGDAAAAVAAMARALGSPFEVTGAAHGRFDGEIKTCLRIEGFAPSVAYRRGQLAGMFAGPSEVLEGAASARLWNGIAAAAPFAGVSGDVWRVSVTPGDAPALIARLPEGSDWYLDWGGGLIWVLCPPGTDLRAALRPYRGHATLIRADRTTFHALGAEEPPAPAVAALEAGIRAKFDPRGILRGAA